MNFWKGVFSDQGNPSFSRVATGFVVAFACGWVTLIVKHSYALPDFSGVCFFIGTLYGINTAPKLAGMLKTPSETPPKGD